MIKYSPAIYMVLKSRREQLELTQEYVAKKLGITAMQLSHFERGRRIPNMEMLDDWAKILKLILTVDLCIKKQQHP